MITTLAGGAARIAELALALGRVDRSVVTHPGGQPESDTDHTVALAWLAPALADATQRSLDPALVAAYAVVHDAVEVFAGDTATIRTLTPGQQAGKSLREAAAASRWSAEFGPVLPWLPRMIAAYESQADPEARFVRAADKIAPKLVHLLNGARDLAAGVTPGEFLEMTRQQRAALSGYAGEFTGLLALYDAVCDQVLAVLSGQGPQSS